MKGLVYNERLDIYVDPNWEKEKMEVEFHIIN